MFKFQRKDCSAKSWTVIFYVAASSLILTSSIFIASIFLSTDKSLAYSYNFCETYAGIEEAAGMSKAYLQADTSSQTLTITNFKGRSKSFSYEAKGNKLCFSSASVLKFIYGVE